MVHTTDTLFYHALDELKRGDCIQSSSKFWFSARRAVRDIARANELPDSSYYHSKRIILAICWKQRSIKCYKFYNFAWLLHINSYNDSMSPEEISDYRKDIARLLELLEDVKLTKQDIQNTPSEAKVVAALHYDIKKDSGEP